MTEPLRLDTTTYRVSDHLSWLLGRESLLPRDDLTLAKVLCALEHQPWYGAQPSLLNMRTGDGPDEERMNRGWFQKARQLRAVLQGDLQVTLQHARTTGNTWRDQETEREVLTW